jgi:hypothetical protein
MARALIGVAVLSGIAPFVWIAQPVYMVPVPWPAPLLPFVGLVIYFIGLGWMVRIYRTNPEPDTRSWRYRDS